MLALLELHFQLRFAGCLALGELEAVQTVEKHLEMTVIGCFVVLGQDGAERSGKNESCLAAPDGEQA